MAEVTNELLFETLVGLRADLAGVREEVREFRSELRQQTGVLARRLDAAEAWLTQVERTTERHTTVIERLDRKFDIVVAALEPMLPEAARQALAHRPTGRPPMPRLRRSPPALPAGSRPAAPR